MRAPAARPAAPAPELSLLTPTQLLTRALSLACVHRLGWPRPRGADPAGVRGAQGAVRGRHPDGRRVEQPQARDALGAGASARGRWQDAGAVAHHHGLRGACDRAAPEDPFAAAKVDEFCDTVEECVATQTGDGGDIHREWGGEQTFTAMSLCACGQTSLAGPIKLCGCLEYCIGGFGRQT